MNKGVGLLVLVLLIAPFVSLAKANFFPPPASLTHVYIRSDGAVDPPLLPIQRSGNTYTFTNGLDNLTLEIERSNVDVNGAGYFLIGNSSGQGIVIANQTNVVVRNLTLTNLREGVNIASCENITLTGITVLQSETGVSMFASSSNVITDCNFTANSGYAVILFGGSRNNSVTDNQFVRNGNGGLTLQPPDASEGSHSSCDYNNISRNYFDSNINYGISIFGASHCRITYNNMSDSEQGIQLAGTSSRENIVLANRISRCSSFGLLVTAGPSQNNVTENTLKDNLIGVEIVLSSNNLFLDNNFINNWKAAEDFIAQNSTTALSAASSVNIWSDNASKQGNFWSDYAGYDDNSDGIGDLPRVVDSNNRDLYPLMRPFGVVPDYSLPSPFPIPVITRLPVPTNQTTPTSEPKASSGASTIALSVLGTIAIIAVALVFVFRRRKTSDKHA